MLAHAVRRPVVGLRYLLTSFTTAPAGRRPTLRHPNDLTPNRLARFSDSSYRVFPTGC
ncbi:hypothetical protein PUN4_760027 [Paraburkholderia unamae]|nr:hypothetical protein PUN4_760027 [Paraburkholderia unamae]